MYAEWREVVADYVAARTGPAGGDLLPRLIGYTVLGAAVAAYDQWLRGPAADLRALLDQALGELARGTGGQSSSRDGPRGRPRTGRTGSRRRGWACGRRAAAGRRRGWPGRRVPRPAAPAQPGRRRRAAGLTRRAARAGPGGGRARPPPARRRRCVHPALGAAAAEVRP